MSKKIQRVGIDIDNTVADFMSVATPLLKEHFNLEPDFSKPVYAIEEVFGINPKARPPGLRETLYEGLNLFLNLPKLEKDIEQLTHKLISRDIETKVYMITARSPSQIIVEDTMNWLENNDFKFTDVFFSKDKASICKAIGIDVMIEDELGQVLSLVETHVSVVVRDQPWNRRGPLEHFESKGQVKRAYNWEQMYNATEEYLV